MTVTTRQYAHLSDHSYGRNNKGDSISLKCLEGKEALIDGIYYKVLKHVDAGSGYQGTIYQRVDSGEIIVAHRGTEFGRQLAKDFLITDVGMVFCGQNRQAEDAIKLTRLALTIAETQKRNGNAAPSVTVTGHSLGGALAQISGHYFGLKGETFNAYGAGGLMVKIPGTNSRFILPEGSNDDFVNHVMAGDLVSAASPQYGRVEVYATDKEIANLDANGYENHRSRWDIRTRIGAAIANIGSHDMHNFLPWDGDGKQDKPIQEDPDSQARAQRYDPMIDKFRGDIHRLREAISAPFRILPGLLHDAPVLCSGQPALKEAEEKQRQEGMPQRLQDAGRFPLLPGQAGCGASGQKSSFDTYLDTAIAAFERGNFREFHQLAASFGEREQGQQLVAQAGRELEQERQQRQQEEAQQRESHAERSRGPSMRMG